MADNTFKDDDQYIYECYTNMWKAYNARSSSNVKKKAKNAGSDIEKTLAPIEHFILHSTIMSALRHHQIERIVPALKDEEYNWENRYEHCVEFHYWMVLSLMLGNCGNRPRTFRELNIGMCDPNLGITSSTPMRTLRDKMQSHPYLHNPRFRSRLVMTQDGYGRMFYLDKTRVKRLPSRVLMSQELTQYMFMYLKHARPVLVSKKQVDPDLVFSKEQNFGIELGQTPQITQTLLNALKGFVDAWLAAQNESVGRNTHDYNIQLFCKRDYVFRVMYLNTVGVTCKFDRTVMNAIGYTVRHNLDTMTEYYTVWSTQHLLTHDKLYKMQFIALNRIKDGYKAYKTHRSSLREWTPPDEKTPNKVLTMHTSAQNFISHLEQKNDAYTKSVAKQKSKKYKIYSGRECGILNRDLYDNKSDEYLYIGIDAAPNGSSVCVMHRKNNNGTIKIYAFAKAASKNRQARTLDWTQNIEVDEKNQNFDDRFNKMELNITATWYIPPPKRAKNSRFDLPGDTMYQKLRILFAKIKDEHVEHFQKDRVFIGQEANFKTLSQAASKYNKNTQKQGIDQRSFNDLVYDLATSVFRRPVLQVPIFGIKKLWTQSYKDNNKANVGSQQDRKKKSKNSKTAMYTAWKDTYNLVSLLTDSQKDNLSSIHPYSDIVDSLAVANMVQYTVHDTRLPSMVHTDIEPQYRTHPNTNVITRLKSESANPTAYTLRTYGITECKSSDTEKQYTFDLRSRQGGSKAYVNLSLDKHSPKAPFQFLERSYNETLKSVRYHLELEEYFAAVPNNKKGTIDCGTEHVLLAPVLGTHTVEKWKIPVEGGFTHTIYHFPKQDVDDWHAPRCSGNSKYRYLQRRHEGRTDARKRRIRERKKLYRLESHLSRP